jgi:hypothetical protein
MASATVHLKSLKPLQIDWCQGVFTHANQTQRAASEGWNDGETQIFYWPRPAELIFDMPLGLLTADATSALCQGSGRVSF